MEFNLEEPNWGDEVTAPGREAPLPPPSEEGPDADGIKRVITYRKNEKGQIEKLVKTYRIQTIQRRVPIAVVERRAQWKKFGQASAANAPSADKTTYPSFEEVNIEKPDAVEKSAFEKIKEKQAAAGDAGGDLPVGAAAGAAEAAANAASMAGAGAAGAAGATGAAGAVYRPPRARTGEAAGGREAVRDIPEEELTQLRVSNLSEDADDDDLRKLFAPFGRLDKIFVARDRERNKPRGFAFVRYMRHDDAAAAMKAIDGLPFMMLILRVEWSKPVEGRGGVPGNVASHHYSGYGKKLAQDIVKTK